MRTAVLLWLGAATLTLALTSGQVIETTTHKPLYTPGGELERLVKQEVRMLLNEDPDLNVDRCTTKCDALFDLVSHIHEHATDQLCHTECRRLVTHHHHTTTNVH
ncbi:uncharacterized protein LOC143287411 [Babylonia areolata]|uniref:uncharacterized protein LOC143287410 n=1 Tax=Babylonia areolata TaxID=304850 RepID=UPI003FD10D6A